jgi:aspartate aminotransferase, mitochondrial
MTHSPRVLFLVLPSPIHLHHTQPKLPKLQLLQYSNPPRHGARIVTTILSDPRLTNDFIDQCKGMADRINDMRISLRSKLEESGSNRNWEHITKQIGMFAYSGMSKEEVLHMKEKHHIYCTADGRISMAGVTSGNVDYIANAIHDVTK